MSRLRWPALGVLVLMIAGAFLLSYQLASDLPGNLDGSAGLIFDPPSKCHNARNWALNGTWITDDWTPIIHSPIYTLLQGGVFRLVGVGLAQLRYLDVAATLASFLLLYLLARQTTSPAGALLVLTLAMASRTFLIYGRSGLLEPLATMLGLLSLWLLSGRAPAYRRPTPGRLIACGVAVALAFLAKATAWPYLVAVVVAPLLLWRGQRRALGWVVVGIFPVALWYLAFFMPTFAEHFHREAGYWSDRAQTVGLWARWIRQPLFVLADDLRPVLVAALIGLPLCFVLPRDEEQRQRWLVPLACSLVFLIGSQFVALVNYRPLRYYLPYLWPALIPAALWIELLIQYARGKKSLTLSPGLALACIPTTALALHFGVLSFLPRTLPLLDRPAGVRLFLALALSSLLLATAWWLTRQPRTRSLARIASAALALCFLGFTAHASGRGLNDAVVWLREPTFAMQSFSQRLGRDYRNAVFAGTSPLFSVIENRHRALKVTSYQLNHRGMQDGTATHLLIPQGMGQDRIFRQLFPDLMARAVPLARPVISGFTHALYALSLQPLELVGASAIRNPDSFSPQDVLQVNLSPDGSLQPVHAAARQTLRPGDELQVGNSLLSALLDEGRVRRFPAAKLTQRLRVSFDPSARDLQSAWVPGATRINLTWASNAQQVVMNVRPAAAKAGESSIAVLVSASEQTFQASVPMPAGSDFTPVIVRLPVPAQTLALQFSEAVHLDYAVALSDEDMRSVTLRQAAAR